MSQTVPLNLVVEDELTEQVIRRVLADFPHFHTQVVYSRGGFGYIRKNIGGFNLAAKAVPYLVLTDLDANPYPPALIQEWLPQGLKPNLIFRVAVRQVEAWLLADKFRLADFLRVDNRLIPSTVEDLQNPKLTLINIARKSRNRDVRKDICPRDQSTSKIGPNYNGRLSHFVASSWNPSDAGNHANSLNGLLRRLRDFQPSWTS